MTKIVQIVHKYPGCCSVLLGKIRLIAGNYQDKQRKNDKYRIARRHTRIDKLLNTILPDVQKKRCIPENWLYEKYYDTTVSNSYFNCIKC